MHTTHGLLKGHLEKTKNVMLGMVRAQMFVCLTAVRSSSTGMEIPNTEKFRLLQTDRRVVNTCALLTVRKHNMGYGGLEHMTDASY